MEIAKPVSGMGRTLGCLRLRLATEEDVERTIDIQKNLRGSQIEAGEYCGLFSLNPVVNFIQARR